MGLNEFFEGLSAVATAGALVAAVYAGLQARRLYRVESDRDEQARAAARASQATKISAWAATRIRTGGRVLFGVVVRNSSDDPVYDVQVTCHGFSSPEVATLQCVPPGEFFVANAVDEDSTAEWDYPKPLQEIRDPMRPFTISDARGVDAIVFRDNTGTAWHRAAQGALTNIS
ncbi:hypothetical protein BIV03_04740 [Curtobacterium sp. MCBA15_016]|uniref:hypothetical protein n=1 Tax=Curtobacterium sp. MCBA15_016 TaxID=1898740 RepID=UPI0008DE77A3|nr:hypothetical protein [Curtobacterium sp. MCBA15_016]OII16921.1 hypothetical protein BIV03_04740 [Curtobacterium sp. MCBA15_016]